MMDTQQNTSLVTSNSNLCTREAKLVLSVDVISPRRSGNIDILNYNNKEGWKKYKVLSEKYAPQIRKIIQIKMTDMLLLNKLHTIVTWKTSE